MFRLDASMLVEFKLLHENERITVDQAVKILQELPKKKKVEERSMKSCLQLLINSDTLTRDEFKQFWKRLNCPMAKFNNVLQFVTDGNEDQEQITLDKICRYFTLDPKEMLARKQIKKGALLNLQ